MRRNSLSEESMISNEDDLKELLKPYEKKIQYTFNDIDIENLLITKNCLLYINILGILILFFTFFSNNFFFSQINDDFYLIKPIFFLVSLFLFSNLITIIFSIKEEEEYNKNIIINQYSSTYTSSLYFNCLYFLTYHFISNENDFKKVYLVIFSFMSLLLISLSYYNYKEKEKNIFFKNIFHFISLSISLSIFTSFNLIILINTFMIIIENSISIYLGAIFSIILIAYYNDYFFTLLYFIFEFTLVRKIDFNDEYFICCIISGFCLIFAILTNINYGNFNLFPFINKSENNEKQKYNDEESVCDIYNKQKNYYYDS